MSHSSALKLARSGLAAFMLLGCGEDPAAEPQPPPYMAADAGDPFGMGVSPILDGAVAAPPVALDAGLAVPDTSVGVNPAPEAGGIMLGVGDASMPAQDAAVVINIPTRSVACGGSDCTTTNNRTCCQAWSRGVGFEGTPSCTTQAACEAEHPPFEAEVNRAVLSECDEPGDCGNGQVCCFVRYGRPIFVDFFSDQVVGPGASRLCLNVDACNAGTGSFSGVLGIPLGLVACKTAADCAGAGSCMPEQAGGLTTGMDGAARPGVMVCR